MKKQLANICLYYRIIAVPFFIIFFTLGWDSTVWMGVALIVFVTASLSDFFDGYFARKYNTVNDFGKLMDPLVDKVLTTAAFVCLVGFQVIAPWGVIVILAREFLVSGVRSLAASNGRVIAARFSGKLKTTTQMIAIILFIFAFSIQPVFTGDLTALSTSLRMAAVITYYLCIALTVYSGAEIIVDYLKSKPAKSKKK